MRTAWIPGEDWTVSQEWGCTDYTAEPGPSICPAAANCASKHFHNGIDLNVPLGTPIMAAVACRIVAVGNDSANPNFGFGKNYPILDINGTQFFFGHTRSVVGVVPRDLRPGDVFAYSGEEGSPGQPHIHGQANRYQNSFQDSIDPVPFLLLGDDEMNPAQEAKLDQLGTLVGFLVQNLIEDKAVDTAAGHQEGVVRQLLKYQQDDRQAVADHQGVGYAAAINAALDKLKGGQ